MIRWGIGAALLALSSAALAAPAGQATPGEASAMDHEKAPSTPAVTSSEEQENDELTTEIWTQPSPPLDLHWHLLALPEYALELAFAPLAVAISTLERYRLDLRLYDLLRNDSGTVVVGPRFKISGNDGMGFGAGLALNRLFERNFYVDFGGLYRLNGDHELSAQYQRTVPWLEGRSLEFRADYESDANLPYYGIGEESISEKHVLREEFVDTYLSLDQSGRGILALFGATRIGFRRSTLSVGEDSSAPGVGEDPAQTLTPPPGYGDTTNLIYLRVIIGLDSRDSAGRPSTGWLSQLETSIAHAPGSTALSAVTGRLTASRYIPILPDRRVLIVHAGLGTSQPLLSGDQIPLHELVTLGRRNFLRGYSRARFRDRYGWWAGAEYRFPMWEYLDSGAALSPIFFVDVGGVSSTLGAISQTPLRYSYGVGLRAARDTTRILNLQFALSPEGSRVNLVFGDDF